MIGAGGMGEVYRARDPRLGREVAIKVLPPQFSTDEDRLRRFEQEARAAGVLNHPNIVSVHDIGKENGIVYVVTELLVGETLRERIGGSALPVRKARFLISDWPNCPLLILRAKSNRNYQLQILLPSRVLCLALLDTYRRSRCAVALRLHRWNV